MSTLIHKAVRKLFDKYKNPHNDPVKRAAHDAAIAGAMSSVLSKIEDDAKTIIKHEFRDKEPGWSGAILADGGVSVSLRVNKGASRFDSKLLPGELIKAGWKDASGKPVTMDEINRLIANCTRENAPSFTVTSTTTDAIG